MVETCPTCGDEFGDDVAMKSHHKQVHGESIAGVKVECDYCGDEFRRTKSHVERTENNFCSRKCRDSWREDEWEHPSKGEQRAERYEVDCSNCGDVAKEVTEWYRDQHDVFFCDHSCKSEYQSEHRGRDWAYNSNGEEVECAWCEDSFVLPQSRVTRAEYNFCSHKCNGMWKSENLSGENSPLWEGGRPKDYGNAWRNLREEVLERDDYKCVICGISNEAHIQKDGAGLHVHHVRPILDSEGDILDDKSGLVTLCRQHHFEWEGVPLRPDLATSQ